MTRTNNSSFSRYAQKTQRRLFLQILANIRYFLHVQDPQQGFIVTRDIFSDNCDSQRRTKAKNPTDEEKSKANASQNALGKIN